MTARWVSHRLASRATQRQVEASIHADRAAWTVDRLIRRLWALFLRGLQTPLIGLAVRHAEQSLRGILVASRDALDAILRRLAAWGHRETKRALVEVLPLGYLQAAVEAHSAPLPLYAPSAARVTREPAVTVPRARILLADELFPPPDLATVQRIIYQPVGGLTWEQRLARAADPARLARIPSTIAQGIAAGKTHGEIAAELVPWVDGVRSAARRIARSEVMRVVHSVQTEAWERGLAPDAYQIHAVLDHATRPAHAARNGQVYYRNPQPGQLGFDDMPRPPLESPKDGSVMAFNCRCFISPLLSAPSTVPAGGFTTAESKLVMEPLTYDAWYRQADPYRQKIVVGARRWAAAGADAGEWATFVSPETGDLLPLETLRGESPEARASRVGSVRSLMASRRENLRRAYLGAGV